ncbi:MAG: hypothetical protein MAG451_02105 [Anaerolineales bacterium]|nr:hypothetical protein [Anaerolineales bacterium]
MSKLQVSARLKIHEGKLDEFKQVAAECVSVVKEKDPGTLQYDWFLNSDQTECVVRETYESSEAVLAHMANLGDALGRLMELADLSVEVFGAPSPQLMEAVAGVPTKVYSSLQGIE